MKYISIASLSLLLLIGCGRVPEPASYDYTSQKKIQASHHWDILASDVASEINRALILSDYISTPVFVRATCGDDNTPCKQFEASTFDETFRDLLITHLVDLGVPTSSRPTEDSIDINFKAQQVYHDADRWRTIHPGAITGLTAGVVVFRHAPWELAAIAAAGAIDWANAAFNSISHYEVVITTSIAAKDRYLYRNTNIYYINDKDAWHYTNFSEPAEIALTSDVMPPIKETEKNLPLGPDMDLTRPEISEPAENATGI